MFNWDLVSPRNLFVIVLFVIIAVYAFRHFHNPHTTGPAIPGQ